MATTIVAVADVTVTTAGTQVQISSNATPITSIIIQADPANTGNIFVGDSNVSSTQGIVLDAAESIAITADMSGRPGGDELILSDIWIDSSVNGEKAKVIYQKRR